LPDRWGNEQLPLYFIAANCDVRYSLAMDNGGVVCVQVAKDKDARSREPTQEQAPTPGK
jgi:hypothetical protein